MATDGPGTTEAFAHLMLDRMKQEPFWDRFVDRTPRKPPSRRTRFRWWRAERRARVGRAWMALRGEYPYD